MNDLPRRAQKPLFWGGIAFIYGSVVALLTGPATDGRLAAFTAVFFAGALLCMLSISALVLRARTPHARTRTEDSGRLGDPDQTGNSAPTDRLEIQRTALSGLATPSALALLFVLTPPALEILSLTPDQPRGPLFWTGVALLAAPLWASRLLTRGSSERLARAGFFAPVFLASAGGLFFGIVLVAVATFS